MSDIRSTFADFACDYALRKKAVRGKIYPALLLDFINDWNGAVARFTALGGTFTRAGATATRVNENGLIEIVPADTMRRDYNPVTRALKGWLLEEARTNELQYSSNIANA